MSLWRSERIRLWIGPSRVLAAPAESRRGSPLPLIGAEDVAPDVSGAPIEDRVLEATRRVLGQVARRARLDVVLSDHFVRYLCLPWRDGLGAADWEAYARHEFDRVYGTCATRREMRLAEAPRGAIRVAAAVDARLIEGLRQAAAAGRSRLRTVEPNACRVAGMYCRRLPGEADLIVAEQGRLTHLGVAGGLWFAVRSTRCGHGREIGQTIVRLLAESQCTGTPSRATAEVLLWGVPEADQPSTLRSRPVRRLPLPAWLPSACGAMGWL